MSPVLPSRLAALLAACAVVAGVLATTAPAAPPWIVVENDETQPVFSYEEAIRETVYVESTIDSDFDGRLDLIAADVMRPKETETGMKVATVMEASPYYGRAFPLPAADAPRGFLQWYDEFFVPRGYAVVEVEMQGTSRSEGCPTMGDREDTLSIKAAVDWLNGRARAFYADGTEAVADWSLGDVGMLGVSYVGTLPNAVAAEGTEGLKTIVPIAAISSWYDYTRDQGIGYGSGWDRRYPEFLANYVSFRRTIPGAIERCEAFIESLGDNAGDDTFDYTQFWAERDYLPNVKNVKKTGTSVFVVHGLEDWNVKKAHFSKWWYELADLKVPRKIWLHRGGHSNPVSLRETEWLRAMHHWMDHWLYEIDNGIMEEPMADVQRPDGTWETHSNWPENGTKNVWLQFGPTTSAVAGTLAFDQTHPSETQSFTDAPTQSESSMMSNAEAPKPNRLVYLTPPLAQDVRVSGTPEVKVRFTSSTASTPLTALLVDYGEAAQTFVEDQTPFELVTQSCDAEDLEDNTGCAAPLDEFTIIAPQRLISRGAIDTKNRFNVREGRALEPGKKYDVSWTMHPHDYVFPAGHRIGIVIVANDRSYISRDSQAGEVTLQLHKSEVLLPVVGGRSALGF